MTVKKKPRNRAAQDATLINTRSLRTKVDRVWLRANDAKAHAVFIQTQLEALARRVKRLEQR